MRELRDPLRQINTLTRRVAELETKLGRVGGSSTNGLTLDADWSQYSSGFAPPVAARQGSTVVLQGLAKRDANPTNDDVIGTLDVGMRPVDTVIFVVAGRNSTAGGGMHGGTGDGPFRVDVHEDGTVEVQDIGATGTGTGVWVSLAGIAFTTHGWADL